NKMESGEITLKPVDCDLKDMCQSLVSDFELQQETRRFVVEVPNEPVVVSCDSDLIGRVIQNLFSNALKFTPPDGTITVEIERINDAVKLTVEDTGPGIPEHHLPKIFDKFYQAEVRGVSTGIGLTFCKLAVELHGGSIGVTSGVGKGSKFWFTLPAVSK
ncbi:MAG TPA: HAMP domain-containing sensor histidine kinase, partial [Bacteroidota bacterium]|nr:HAMP domain-containing sensor histidine kinase [Bacteroidota bacterium]